MSEKKKAVQEEAISPDTPLNQLVQDCVKDKYRMISLTTRWAQEIKQRDQSTLLPQELLNQSMREILSKKISLEEIEKLPPAKKAEKKDIELTLPTITLKPDASAEKDEDE